MSGIAIILLSWACSPEPKDIYDPQPHNLEVPDFVEIYLGNFQSPQDNPLTVEGVNLGRRLFYDKKLSNDFTMSCATCHKQENAFDDPRPFSEGTNGSFGNRNAMAIVNLGWGTSFFWDGRRNSLEDQAHDPVVNPIEMANSWPTVVSRLQADEEYPSLFYKAFGSYNIDSNLVAMAIAQFERTLVSFNSPFDRYYFQGETSALNAQEISGLDIFLNKAHCNDCHSDVLLTDNAFRNNGLDISFTDNGLGLVTANASDNGKFKVPTLRNVELTSPYMHDSRFNTLEQVIDFYSSNVKSASPNLDQHMIPFGNGLNLTIQEKADLLAFLKVLTDSSFINNSAYGDPY